MTDTKSLIGSLTVRDNLTAIHCDSGLNNVHEGRHTPSGFLVDGEALKHFAPTPPSRVQSSSWVWKHGEAISDARTGVTYWMCRTCYDKSPADRRVVFCRRTSKGTNQLRRHMSQHGYNEDGSMKSRKRKASPRQESIVNTLKRQKTAQQSIFNKHDWKSVFLEWAIVDDISLRKTASNRLKRMACYRNPIMEPFFPGGHATTRVWVIKLFEVTKPHIRLSLANARSRITISFDGWKSDNELDLLGVFAHYFDEQYQLKTVLISLLPTYGNHTGEEQARCLLAVLKDYQITTKVGYFMADNATNNDRAIEVLKNDLNIEPHKQRLRCACHILNLVVKAMLYGVDSDCIDNACNPQLDAQAKPEDLDDSDIVQQFEAVQRVTDEQARLRAWRKKGPLGKLHNIVVHARFSAARREVFKAKQRASSPDERIFELVLNGGIRWQSDHDMVERSIKLRDAIELYCSHFRDDLTDDTLSNDDWLELKEVLALLGPMKRASKVIQSDGSFYGGLWQTLTSLEWLLSTLEAARSRLEHSPNSHLKAIINLGWKKLNKYYALSDRTAAYRAAIALHPSLKMRWFDKNWSGLRCDNSKGKGELWTVKARRAIEELYSEYKKRYSDSEATAIAALNRRSPRHKALDEFELSLLMEDDEALDDELQRYLAEPLTPYNTNPVSWWQVNHYQYPILRHMALDLLAAPSSSAAAERQFSLAGHVLNEDRYQTLTDLAEANQCLKNWYLQDLVKPSSAKAVVKDDDDDSDLPSDYPLELSSDSEGDNNE